MLTLSERDAMEQAARERAWVYERVTGALERARKDVARLTACIEEHGTQLRAIGQLQEIAATLPPTIIGKGGIILRAGVLEHTHVAVKQIARKRELDQEQLDKALAQIPTLEEQLKEFEEQ